MLQFEICDWNWNSIRSDWIVFIWEMIIKGVPYNNNPVWQWRKSPIAIVSDSPSQFRYNMWHINRALKVKATKQRTNILITKRALSNKSSYHRKLCQLNGTNFMICIYCMMTELGVTFKVLTITIYQTWNQMSSFDHQISIVVTHI